LKETDQKRARAIVAAVQLSSVSDAEFEASLLAHVVDASDPGFERQLKVTEEVLDEIGAQEYFRETSNPHVMEKVDERGKVLGFSVMRVSALHDVPMEVAL
jgi:50S ribosomal subunit-associated GTPase HflX